jgi:hypothetical protein
MSRQRSTRGAGPASRKKPRDVRRSILAALAIPRDKQNLMATTGFDWRLVTGELWAMRKEGIVLYEQRMWRRTVRFP